MGSSPTKRALTSSMSVDGEPEYRATDSAGSDMLAALSAKEAMDQHKQSMGEHPELEELLPGFKTAVEKLETASQGGVTNELLKEVTETLEERIEQPMHAYETKDQRRLMCDQLGYDGFVQATVKYCKAIQKDGPFERDAETASAIMTLMNITKSLTDRSKLVCQLSKQGLLELLLTELNRTELREQYSVNAVINKLVLIYLGVVYNCAKGGVSRQYFSDPGAVDRAVDVIMPYTKSDDNSIKALAVMAIAFIVEEGEQNDLMVADDDMIIYVLKTFSDALERSDKASLFNVEELAQGLSSLANHDKNKQIIVKHGGLKLLVRLMKEGDDKEIYWATRCVWTLSFDEGNKEKIKAEPSALSTLEELKSHKSQEVSGAAEGALWVIQGEQEHIRAKTALGSSQVSLNRETKDQQGSSVKLARKSISVDSGQASLDHVMISYQWDVQKLMIKVKEQLEKNGYRVWLDLDEMGGSTLQAMADAVENAAVVLVCVSEKYKDSPNCRIEAEYTFQQRKEIIPLLVEENYKPTGWLGAIIGTKFYIDFSKKTQPFGVCIQQLIKQLGNKGKSTRSVRKLTVTEAGVGSRPSTGMARDRPSMAHDRPSTAHPVSRWSNDDVIRWLRNNEIQCKALEQLVGEDIVFLMHMRGEAPEFFYYYTVKHLGMTSIPDMRKLRNALIRLL